MFIDIGNGNVIRSSTIITVIDYELVPSSVLLQELIERHGESEMVRGPKSDAKSVIVTTEATYFSALSVATLKKRTSIRAIIRNLEDYT